MSTMALNVTTGQALSIMPEAFQQQLIEGITKKMHLIDPPPILLRAPTGSGKTFVLCKVLGNISDSDPVIWLWFVPFVNLVNQTLDALVTNAGDLTPALFADGINQDPQPGQVLISTTQGVSRAAWRKQNYDAGGGEQMRTPAEFIALARANGCKVGVIVDEAHIALDQATEFGQFVHWLNPHYLAMATATPKSERINQFLASAQMGSFESFNVSRDDVVAARLNKAYIEAIVYQLRETTASVADLRRTVLRQAWLRNQALQQMLTAHGIPMTPLLLVQVENGKGSIEEAERDLIELCKVQPQAIGKHSSDAPDPLMMDAIANDETKQVLIFKQSAGTGFDAPRAFVLASTKTVNDTDFAMQFIGRVMRVARQIRAIYSEWQQIPPDLNTAYVYLANAEAQHGYQQAVQITDSVQSQLEGQVERMAKRSTRSGATVFTNRPTAQQPLSHRFPLNDIPSTFTSGNAQALRTDTVTDDARAGREKPFVQKTFFNELDMADLDTLAPDEKTDNKPSPHKAGDRAGWEAAMKACGISSYPIRRDVPQAPVHLKREERPDAMDMAQITERVATRLILQDRHVRDALLAVRDRLQEIERHTELTRRVVADNKVHIVVDRNRIAAEAKAAMQRLPQIEDADQRILIDVLASRVTPRLNDALEEAAADVSEADVRRMARTAACWLIRVQIQEIEEALHQEIASLAVITDAAPLPDTMLFPTCMALPSSSKNLYGILPPGKEDLQALEQHIMLEDRQLLEDRCWQLGHGEQSVEIRTGRFDQSFSLNPDELRFALALDRAPFVAWWFRNPDKKSYSVRLVRGEHRNFFYPDFVVCLSHVNGAQPIQRLIETKHDLKDARRKSKHIPEHFGRVLFLTKDGGQFFMVTDDGGIGEPLELNDLEGLREALQRTVP